MFCKFLFLAAIAYGVSGSAVHVIRAKPAPVPTPLIPLPPPQRLNGYMTITQASLSIDNLDKLDQDVDAASAQAVNILQSFSTIGNKLQAIDALNLQSMKFTPQWSTFGNRYRAILRNSSSLASNIADLALAFNSEVLDLVNNTSIPADEKVNILNDFVTDSTILRNVSNSVAVAFEELSQDILTFRGNFDNFAAPRLNNDTAAIQTLMQDIANLQQQVANMETAIEALGVTLAATLLGSAAAMAIFPLFAPAVLVAAGIAEGAILASQAGLAAAIAADQSDISTKQGQLQTLKDQVNTIDSTQYSLDTLSIGDLPTVASHVTFFTAVWEDVSDECTKLIGWLEDGADNADTPDILEVFASEASTIYEALGNALQQYADKTAV